MYVCPSVCFRGPGCIVAYLADCFCAHGCLRPCGARGVSRQTDVVDVSSQAAVVTVDVSSQTGVVYLIIDEKNVWEYEVD